MEELRGDLAIGVLPELLRKIFLARRTGTLQLACGVEKSEVEFSDGYLTHVGTTLPGAHLGDLLVQSGFLSMRDRDACLEIAALAQERVGQTMLRHRLIDPEQLAQGLALQLREVLARTLGWRSGVYTFTDGQGTKPSPLDETAGPRLDPREVLLDATWTLGGDASIDDLVGDLTQKLRKANDERLLYLDFRLAPADAFLLSRVDGELTAARLLQLSPLSSAEAKASLAGLLCVGAIEYVGAPPPTSATTKIARFEVARLAARIGSSDPYEILGVAPGASPDDVRWAYLALLRSCDPASTADRELRPILRKLSTQLADAFKEIEGRRAMPLPEAAKRPMERRLRVPPPAPAPRPAIRPPSVSKAPAPVRVLEKVGDKRRDKTPEKAPDRVLEKVPPAATPVVDPLRALESSAEAFDAGRFHEALAILHDAIPHLEGRMRRSARVRKARVLLSVENGAKLAEEELRTAIGEDPGNAEAHAVLGGIYRERGSLALAMMEFRKTLDLEPRNVIAREALAELRAAPAEKTSEASVLKRLFGR